MQNDDREIALGLRYSAAFKTMDTTNVLFSSNLKIGIKSMSYFADPFASWQRGSNENYNGLLRQYIPKKRRLSTVTDEELKMIEDRLNHRPRKRLGFKTQHQVFHESLNRVALRT